MKRKTAKNSLFLFFIVIFLTLWSSCSKDIDERREALVGDWFVEEHLLEFENSTSVVVLDTILERNVTFNEDGNCVMNGTALLSNRSWLYQGAPEQIAIFSEMGGSSRSDIFPIVFDVTDNSGNVWKLYGEKQRFLTFTDTTNIDNPFTIIKTTLQVDWKLKK